jgi:hypothetical protein
LVSWYGEGNIFDAGEAMVVSERGKGGKGQEERYDRTSW